ncbi:hypothetical protein KAH55_03815, partial [bacterium]|nr:hypothetical protein [bacterium]
CKSKDQLQFVVSNLKSGSKSKFGPIMITMPEPPDKWSGKALVDMQGVINGYKVRYQQPIRVKLAKTKKKNQSSIQKSEPLPRRTRPISLWMRKKPAPQIDGKTIPPYSQAVDYWQLSKSRWMLYKSPSLLLTSKDSGKTWEVGRSDFAYRPCGLYVSSTNSMLIWGTKPTRDVNKGIAYVVEESKDGGNSWSEFKIPKADFLLSITVDNEKNLTVSAIRIPKEGIPEGKDWFEMPRTTFMSQDGTNFTEIVGPSFSDIEKVHTKSIAPNGKFRVFLSVCSWLDTSYTLYLAKGPDEIPIQTTLPASKCEIVWSPNSRILALKRKGKFFAYIDTKSGESDNCNIPNKRSNSRKEKAKLVKFDKKVSELIKINTEPQTELEKKSISE